MDQLIQAVGFGLVVASFLSLAAVGFTVQYGSTAILNLTYGHTMVAAMFVAYWMTNSLGLSIWLTLLGGAIAGAVLTGGMHRLVFVPFLRRGSGMGTMIIVSLALGTTLEAFYLASLGPGFFSIPGRDTGSVELLGMTFTPRQLAIIALAAVCMAAVHGVLRYTRLGKAIRATSSNASLARACGIPTGHVATIVWFASGALCGLAGVAFILNVPTFTFTTGATLLLLVIAAAVFGGIGQPYGAMLGALVIGIGPEVSAIWIEPALKDLVAFGILVVMLLIRPSGLIPAPAPSLEVVK